MQHYNLRTHIEEILVQTYVQHKDEDTGSKHFQTREDGCSQASCCAELQTGLGIEVLWRARAELVTDR